MVKQDSDDSLGHDSKHDHLVPGPRSADSGLGGGPSADAWGRMSLRVGGRSFEVTGHAKQRMRERGVHLNHLYGALARGPWRRNADQLLYKFAGVLVPVDLETGAIKTVLPRGACPRDQRRDSGVSRHRRGARCRGVVSRGASRPNGATL